MIKQIFKSNSISDKYLNIKQNKCEINIILEGEGIKKMINDIPVTDRYIDYWLLRQIGIDRQTDR